MKKEPGKIIDILLVEDNPGDVDLVREALKESRIRIELHVACDGVQAMKFLRRQDNYADAPWPDLVLLDLNLPKRHGQEVLQDIKSDPALQTIPVIVLTGSSEAKDISRAYEMHANCYITKPIHYEQFVNIVKSIENFWLTIVKLPSTHEKRGC
jgi:CheY-like chemotaxis protein